MRRLSPRSLWLETTPSPPRFPQLEKSVTVDVAIVGCGITGLTAGLLLQNVGKRVALIDQSQIASGESGHTTAHITEMIDTRYSALQANFGKEGTRLVAESSRSAIEQIAHVNERLHLSCDFTRLPGYLYTEKTVQVEELQKELMAAQESGVQAQWETHIPLPFPTRGGLRIENQAQFHPRKYLLGIASFIAKKGALIYEKCRVTEVKDGTPCEILTESGGKITANSVIMATNTASFNRFTLHTKVAAYRSYAMSVQLKDRIPPAGLYWDSADPYHYVRNWGEYWIIGGEDHKTGTKVDTHESFEALEAYTRSHFQVAQVDTIWSGQILEPVDGLPYLGRNPHSDNIYVATGFSGNGMTFGTLGGMLTADLILGNKNPWAELYRPSRIKPIRSLSTFVSENKDYPIHLMKDRIHPQDISAVVDLQPGDGNTFRMNGETLAIHRDESGHLHALNAVCTHLGCHVHWNRAESSWDCPCHGSRFSSQGEVLNGPAIQGLRTVDLKQEQPAPRRRKEAA